jgi:bacillithiol biosynthesis cysteine-adding enzyme BshC
MDVAFSSAFLARSSDAAGFLAGDFRDPAARVTSALRAAQRPIDPRLLTELRTQNEALGPSSARQVHLEALASPSGGYALVVTGQQVGLLLGPLYTIYKAATAIAAAQRLTQESGVQCLPLFWLQTEDHDFAEIDHCVVYRPQGPPLKLQLAPRPESRISVEHLCLGPEIETQLGLLREALAELPHAIPFVDQLAQHYRAGVPLVSAFAGMLAAIFADEGLLFLDPRRPVIAELASPLYRRSLLMQRALNTALLARTDELRANGFAEQVRVRPDTSLLFFHPTGPTGPRYRLIHHDNGWLLPPQPGPEPLRELRFSEEELLTIVDREPLRFSTSALLRPLLQDTLLPTAMYVGGPGELNYFAQLAPLYQQLSVPPCLFLPRARFRCTDDACRSLLRKLSLTAAQIEAPRTALLDRIAHDPQSSLPNLSTLRRELLADVEARLTTLAGQEESLTDAVERTRRSLRINIDRLLGKYERRLREQDRVHGDRIARLQALLFPDGTPQERVYSLPSFAGRAGLFPFKEAVLHSLREQSPFSEMYAVRDLEL